LGPLGTAATNRPIVPAPGNYDDGEIGGMMIGTGNRSMCVHVTVVWNNNSGQNVLIYVINLVFLYDSAISESVADGFCGSELSINHHNL
jgi:hypothetical protein